MFRKVLVANRGEIAVRVMRTLREMGISPVAVHSDVDRAALHVRSADEAYEIGPAPAAESYLVIERILDACKKSGAEAVHPGYGFLSENAEFARACADAGIAFIGPSASAMQAMGNKTAARARMIAAQVPVVPGSEASSFDELAKAADKLGYPVMLKAAAGGGGKGMRLVDKAEALRDAYERAQSEAKKAFGDDSVYLEKAIVRPRHVEIQVLADREGTTVHLFERDCSIQRRHQKVIEETRSPAEAATDEKIQAMGEVAVRAAKAVGYEGAGTIEFLMGADGSFYFLEMNTRLQVEHPITELVTGIDLVREQVRVADGEPLGYDQSAITRRGHAIQCRVYAEDPASGFLPSPGRVHVLRTPGGPGVRDDTGVYEGADIAVQYDPLISKLCIWASDRPRAIARMKRALGEYVVAGIKTNLAFHLAVMDHPEFIAGTYDTGFIERNKSALLNGTGVTDDGVLVGAALHRALADRQARTIVAGTTTGVSAWRLGSLARLRS